MLDGKKSNRPKDYNEFEEMLEFKKTNEVKDIVNKENNNENINKEVQPSQSYSAEPINIADEQTNIFKNEEHQNQYNSPSKSSYIWTVSSDKKSCSISNNECVDDNINLESDTETATSSIDDIQSRNELKSDNEQDNECEFNIDDNCVSFESLEGVVESDDTEISDETLKQIFEELGIDSSSEDDNDDNDDISIDDFIINFDDFSVEDQCECEECHCESSNDNDESYEELVESIIECDEDDKCECEECHCESLKDNKCECEECHCESSNDNDESYEELVESIIECDEDDKCECEECHCESSNDNEYSIEPNDIEIIENIVEETNIEDNELLLDDKEESNDDEILVVNDNIEFNSLNPSDDSISINQEYKKEIDDKTDAILKHNESLEKIKEKIAHLELSIKEFDKTNIYSQKELIEKLTNTKCSDETEKEQLIKSANQKIEYIQDVIQRAKDYDCSFLEDMINKIKEALKIFEENNK